MILCSLFFTHPAPTPICTLSLHDALPIWDPPGQGAEPEGGEPRIDSSPAVLNWGQRGSGAFAMSKSRQIRDLRGEDRKSTRLNSSHSQISYAVFCLKKKNKTNQTLDCSHM